MKKNNYVIVLAVLVSFAFGYFVKDITAPKTQVTNNQEVTSQVKEKIRKRQEWKNKKPSRQNNAQKGKIMDEQTIQNRKEIQEQKINKNLSTKKWWGKKGKAKDIEFSEEVKAIFNEQLQESLNLRKQLRTKLLAIHQSNKQALAQSDLNTIEENLLKAEELNNRWMAERRAAISKILAQLTPQQLQDLANSSADVSSLNWFNFKLDKGIWSADKSNKKSNIKSKNKKRGG